MTPVLTAVTDGVHLAHTPLVNWTLVADDTGVMLIDAGLPGSRDDVMTSVEQLGFAPSDVHAILLTHAHVDHLGSAIWFAATYGTPVYCHADEVGHARRDCLQQASPVSLLAHAWQPRWLRWSLEVARMGGLVRDGIPSARPLNADIAATLPGRPRAIPTPGHTGGHCSYVVDGVLVSGDALVTGHPLAPGRRTATVAVGVQPRPAAVRPQPFRARRCRHRRPRTRARTAVDRADRRGGAPGR